MKRSDLLLAVARAGSLAALGRADTVEQQRLDGRKIEVKIRFGCPGSFRPSVAPMPSEPPFAIGYDEESRTLRLRAKPDLTATTGWVAALGGEHLEAVEGFWIYRPWLLSDGCPAEPLGEPANKPNAAGEETADPDASPPANAEASFPARVGIAQFFTRNDSRTGRRSNRSFETTKVLSGEEQPSRQGYNLVLAGRLVKLTGGRVIACRIKSMDMPPECVVSAQFDHVKVERADNGAMLAEWGL
jgi:hypothetical protein